MKTYIRPTLISYTIQTASMIALSAKNGEADDSAALSNGHRGTWGNLWEEEEDDD